MAIKVHKIRVTRAKFINFCYLLVDEASGEAALIDPAWELESIVRVVSETGAKLKMILITHAHFDHINLAPVLATRYEVPIYVHDHETTRFQSRFPIPLSTFNEFSAAWVGDSNIFVIPLGVEKLYACNTPGHTRGSMCFLTPSSAITGDTLFIEGCGLCSETDGDPVDMFWSLSLIRRLVAPDTSIFPGHSYGVAPGARFAEVMQKNIYLNINDVNRFVSFRMRENQTNLFGFK